MKTITTPYGGINVEVKLNDAWRESSAVWSTTIDIAVVWQDKSTTKVEYAAKVELPMLCVGDAPTEDIAADWVKAGIDRYKDQLKSGAEPRIDQLMYPGAAAYALLTHINAVIKKRSDTTLEFWQKNMD